MNKKSEYHNALHSLCVLMGEPFVDYCDILIFYTVLDKVGIEFVYRNLN